MRVPVALLVEDITQDDSGRLNLLGVVDFIRVASFPATVEPLHLYFRFVGTAFDKGTTKTVGITLMGLDEVVWEDVVYQPITDNDVVTPKHAVSVPLPPLTFPAPGEYEFIIGIDGKEETR